MLPKTRLALLFFVASCASPHRGPTTVEGGRARRASSIESAPQLSKSIVRFSTAASQALNDHVVQPPPSNSYSHQRLLGPKKRLGEPQVDLERSGARPFFASTDCSGWLSFVLNTVSPFHAAVLQSQRARPEHNRAYSEDFVLRERWRPWARAFVVTKYLRSDHAKATGFEPVTRFEDLKTGDIGAYAMGRYANPSDASRPKPRDTGHVFVVVGAPTVVDPATPGYDGRGSLRKDVAKVIAVPVVDSSSTVHFEPDARKNGDGRYSLPVPVPHSRAKAGGVGTGTMWFALNDEGQVLQRRMGPQQKYRAVLARAARLSGRISLEDPVLDGGDALLVRAFDNSPSEFEGVAYGVAPVDLTGQGGLRLARGRFVLNGENDFTGGVTVQAADVIVASPSGLGTGDVVVRGGSVKLERPAIGDSATLQLAEELPDGAIQLAFKGRDVVRMLEIGGQIRRCGTWGGPESNAMFVDPVFSGRGVIELTAQPLEACTTARDRSKLRRTERRESSKLRASYER